MKNYRSRPVDPWKLLLPAIAQLAIAFQNSGVTAAGLDRGVDRLEGERNIEIMPDSNPIFWANGFAFDDRSDLDITESLSLIGPAPPF